MRPPMRCSVLALGFCACVSGIGGRNAAEPPPLVEERPPAPGSAAIWVSGSWHWNDRDWVWLPGRWEGAPSSVVP